MPKGRGRPPCSQARSSPIVFGPQAPPTLPATTPMTSVFCKDCRHFREAPYEANITGCWQPDNLTVTQKLAYLDEQRQPGDHRKINLRGDCAQFEARPVELGLLPRLWQRLLRA